MAFVRVLTVAALLALPSARVADAATRRLPADPRLDAAVTVEAVCRPLPVVAASITEQTGVKVAVDEKIAEWKATVLFRGEAGALLSVLCRQFDLEAVVDAAAPGPAGTTPAAYRLRPTDEGWRRLRAYLQRKERAAAERTERDSRLLARQVDALLRDPNPDARRGGEAGSPLGENAVPLLRLLESLGPDALSQVCRSRPRERADPIDKTPAMKVPVSSLRPAQREGLRAFLQSGRADAAREGAPDTYLDLLAEGLERLPDATLSFWSESRNGSQILCVSMRYAGMAWAPDYTICVAPASPVQEADGGHDDDDPASASRPAHPEPAEARAVTLALNDADHGAALLALAKAACIDVVADGFTLMERMSLPSKERRAGDVLRGIESTFHVTGTWHKGRLLVRHTRWRDLLPEEPPDEVLSWLSTALVKARRPPTFAELAWMGSRLTSLQLRGLARWRAGGGGMLVAALVRCHGLYAWCGALPDRQLARLQAEGLDVGSLTVAQQDALAALTGVAARAAGTVHVSLLRSPDDPMSSPTLVVRSRDGRVLAEAP